MPAYSFVVNSMTMSCDTMVLHFERPVAFGRFRKRDLRFQNPGERRAILTDGNPNEDGGSGGGKPKKREEQSTENESFFSDL